MSNNPFFSIENPELVGYEYAWVTFFKDGKNPEGIIDNDILSSWKRCLGRGLDYTAQKINNIVCTTDDLAKRIEQQKSDLEIADPIMKSILKVSEEKSIVVCIVDTERVILKAMSNDDTQFSDYKTGLYFNEEARGTNCIDLTMRYEKNVSVIGAQHYYQPNHKYAGYAAPIYDTSGELKYGIALFVKLENMSDYMNSIAVTAARAIENGFMLAKSREIITKQNNEKQDILDSVTDAIIYVNKDRIITHANRCFVEYTGIKRSELIGNSITTIETVPNINELARVSWQSHSDEKVKLCGKEKVYNCILSHSIVHDPDKDEDNIVWEFTEIEGLRELADKVDMQNRAFFTFDSIVGDSPQLKESIELAKKVAIHDAKVMIEGESGTGKEIFAQAIHNSSMRNNGPFVAVDCGAIPRELLESEIFGYEEGAYTGARKGGHRGKFELAHNGTLFLDEIGNLPLDMQAKLLRVLQDNRVVRIGGYNPILVDAQIIAATNLDLSEEVKAGTFREDLYYRLNVVHIKLPPLRERRGDIELLINNYIKKNKQTNNQRVKGIDDDAMQILCRYNWPGNIRQLHNILERMIIMSEHEMLSVDLIPDNIVQGVENYTYSDIKINEVEPLESINAKYINNVLKKFNGNVKKTAENLEISRATVYRVLRKAGLMSDSEEQ